MGDTFSIEQSFGRLLGIANRGDVNDADVFKNGSHKSLAAVLKRAAHKLEERTKALHLCDDDTSGSSGARIEAAIATLRLHAETLAKSAVKEGQSYQWEIIGALIGIIVAMLEHYEAA